ncbi:MAG: alpha/beta hydrolase family protein, partial [Phycisphaerae bacterium]
YRIWVPVLSEEEPYATREVDEAAALIDWLDAEGRSLLGVDRVYIVGYSTGGTVVNFLNLRSRVDAMVSIAGLTQPDQLQQNETLDRLIADLFDCNSAFRQLERTIDHYSRVGWGNFDMPARVTELKSPMLMLTTLDDWVQWPANTQAVEQAYNDALAEGAIMPPITFQYFETGGHSAYVSGEKFVLAVLNYLEEFEALAFYLDSILESNPAFEGPSGPGATADAAD